jgi:hypothetical protein
MEAGPEDGSTAVISVPELAARRAAAAIVAVIARVVLGFTIVRRTA